MSAGYRMEGLNQTEVLREAQVLGRGSNPFPRIRRVLVDRGPWYNWALEDLELYESCRETWGERHPGEAWFGLLTYRTRLFYNCFPHQRSWQSVNRLVKAFAVIYIAII